MYYDKISIDINKPKVEGTLTFEKTRNGIKITSVKLQENGVPFDNTFDFNESLEKQ